LAVEKIQKQNKPKADSKVCKGPFKTVFYPIKEILENKSLNLSSRDLWLKIPNKQNLSLKIKYKK